MRLTIPIALALLLGGCDAFQSARDQVITRGAQVNDEALITSELVICRAASVGSVMRRYWGTPETAEAWRQLCAEQPAVPQP